MVNARLCEKTRPGFFFTSQRHLRARDVQILRLSDVIYKRKQKNRYIETLRDLNLGKKSRLQTKMLKNRECDTQTRGGGGGEEAT